MILKNLYYSIIFSLKEFLKFFVMDVLAGQHLKNKLAKRFFLKNLGKDVVLLRGVRWFHGANVFISNNVFVNMECYFDDKAKIEIGKGTWLGQYCKFITATHDKETMEETAKPIAVGNYCWIGANVTVLPGVKIGDFSVIGGGSVVVKDIPGYSIAAGNPAVVIKKREVKTPYKVAPGIYVSDFKTLP